MDENQIGPNINTTPVRRYVRDGPYPGGKAVPFNWEIPGSNPNEVNLQNCRAKGQGHHGETFVFVSFAFFFCFDFVPFVGNPRECRADVAFPPTCGPHQF